MLPSYAATPSCPCALPGLFAFEQLLKLSRVEALDKQTNFAVAATVV